MTEEIGLGNLWCLLYLFYGWFHAFELQDGEQGGDKVLVILIEGIDLGIVAHKAEKLDACHGIDVQHYQHYQKKVGCSWYDGNECFDGFPYERNMVKD